MAIIVHSIMQGKNTLEICCYSAESAQAAEKAGANRIELCDNYGEGGTTPSFATVQWVVENLSIPVNVIVRPRGGDFLYTAVEYDIIKRDVEQLKKMKVNGIVIGFLNPDGSIDAKRTQEIVALAHPMEVCFHRAFDVCRDPFEALAQLKALGVKRILTSGTKASAPEGTELLAELVKEAGNDISIMPGGGINSGNIAQLKRETKATEFHASTKMFLPSKMKFHQKGVAMGTASENTEYQKISVDSDEIAALVKTLKEDNF